MPEHRFQHYAFIAGELDRAFYARTDLEKYDLGVALAHNFFVDFRGGLSTRAGSEFSDFADADALRLFTFKMGEGVSDIIIILGASHMRFMQEGRYLLEASAAVVANVSNVVEVTGHSFAVDDLVYLEGTGLPDGTYIITATTTNTFTVELLNGVVPVGENLSGGTAALVLTFDSPWTAAELRDLQMSQSLNSAEFTCLTKPVYELLFDGTTFTLAEIEIGTEIGRPSGLGATASAAGSARTIFAVAAVDAFGNEGQISHPFFATNIVNYTVTAGSVTFRWNRVPGAAFYRVYRSIVTENGNLSLAQDLGFIGETRGLSLVDQNIVPDYTRKPRQFNNPFANGAIQEIAITNVGSGYTSLPTISISDGTGFSGYCIRENDDIVAIVINNGGEGYTESSTITLTGGGGTGATAEIVSVSPPSGNYPRAAVRFQQRRVYGGTINLPMTVVGSRPLSVRSFETSSIPVDDDAYSLTLDSNEVTPIKHLRALKDGLLIFHGEGIDRLLASEGAAVTPNNNTIQPQVRVGVGDTPPQFINDDIVYSNKYGTAVHALLYTFYTNSFTNQDVTVLCPHLFGANQKPVRLVWNDEPNKLLWVLREDGTWLTLTYYREQEIFGWAQHSTAGRVLDIALGEEGRNAFMYALVERSLNGSFVMTVERFYPRAFNSIYDAWCVDCGLASGQTRGVGILRQRTVGEEHFLYSTEVDFAGTFAGDRVFARGGVFEIDEVVSDTEIRVRVIEQAVCNQPGSSTVLCTTLDWYTARGVTSITNLWHLEGQTVSIFADGEALEPAVVQNGQITLPNLFFRVVIGLPFTARGTTLPISSVQIDSNGKQKRVMGAAVRLRDTRGLFIGGRTLYEMKDRTFEALNELINLRSDVAVVEVDSLWDIDQMLTFEQRYPLPATVLGLITEAEVE